MHSIVISLAINDLSLNLRSKKLETNYTMKKKLLIPFMLLFVAGVVYFKNFHKSDVEKLREKHQSFLDNSPFKETQHLSRKERKALGLPPNAYNEQKWELSMDPNTGRPMPERVDKLQQELRAQRLNRGGGGDNFSPWIDRGPNNIGGRTRGIMFDPNDTDFNRVFAGGVSGGLWVNEDIVDPNSEWSLVQGIGANISVNVIVHDPNDTNTFYIASGESYTSGDAVGRGVWKSTDGGVTWTNIFGGPDGTITNSGQVVNGIFYINDIIARDVNGSTELYIAVAGASYGSASVPNNFHGANDQGVYKSTDGGTNWTRFTIDESNGSPSNPNDLELDIDNNIWFTTTRSVFGVNGGKIYKSTDGVNFTLEHTISSARRTELEPSSTDANKFWIAVDRDGTRQADLFFTDDAFANVTQLNEPDDADNGIPAADYARGQAFFNLPIEVDSNDNLFVGGIDAHRSTDDGTNWTQISKWSNNPGLNTLNVPLVHADHHAIVFRPGAGNENQALIGTDGGVYYTPDITAAQGSLNITSRERGYNTTQFYYGAIDPSGEANGDDLFGGTQDNGSPIITDAAINTNSFTDFFGGDGGFAEFDDNGQYMIQTYTGNSHRWVNYPTITQASTIVTGGGGSFINVAELDKNLDILYANASGATIRIERVTNFVPGSGTRRNTFMEDALFDASPSALKVSPYTTASTTLLIGLRNSKLIKVEEADLLTPASWTDISGPSFVGSISDIEFGENEDEIFVTFHNYGVTNIWFTDDGGTTWTDIEGDLPDLPVKCILQNPLLPQELIIGTELGIWRTQDYTATNVEWTQSFNGMSDVTVLDLDLRPSDNTILATTHGRGMFTSVFTADVASVDDVLADKKVFSVYPTISNGDFTVFAKNELGNAQIFISDITGKQVYNAELNFNERQNQAVSVNLRAGIYIVNIIDQNNRRSSEKIIIK